MESSRDKDYYQILDLPRTATSDDIRLAYRKLALKWHPDKNPTCTQEAEKRFKEISEAYQVLSDDSSRSAYDNSSYSSGDTQQFDFSQHYRSADDLFREMFGGRSFEETLDDIINDSGLGFTNLGLGLSGFSSSRTRKTRVEDSSRRPPRPPPMSDQEGRPSSRAPRPRRAPRDDDSAEKTLRIFGTVLMLIFGFVRYLISVVWKYLGSGRNAARR